MHDEPPKLLTLLDGFFVGPGPEAALAGEHRTQGQTHSDLQYREISRRVAFTTVVVEVDG